MRERRRALITYPATVIKEESGFSLVFVDFPNAFTQGETMEELKENARDVLSMAVKHLLDTGKDLPFPSAAAGDTIIVVEPYPEIRQRMGHKKGCECPVCRNARGERVKTKKGIYAALNKGVLVLLKQLARKTNKSEASVIEEALLRYYREDARMTPEELSRELLKEGGEDPTDENMSELQKEYGPDLDRAAAGDVGALVRVRVGLRLPVVN